MTLDAARRQIGHYAWVREGLPDRGVQTVEWASHYGTEWSPLPLGYHIHDHH